MKHLFTTLFIFTLLTSPITLKSHAATIQLPQTGQTSCYDTAGATITCTGTGQDGELQTGLAWPNPRFTDNGDQSITDNLTGLIWTKDANLIKTHNPIVTVDGAGIPTLTIGATWQQALDYIKTLNTENFLGHNDWRLPNINELASLVNKGQSNPATWLNGQGFTNVLQSDYISNYWSSNTIAGSATYTSAAWLVDMNTGNMGPNGKGAQSYVWPVRSEESSALSSLTLPKTGQITCYNASGANIACTGTGQDGELQKGTAWLNPRFTDNGDQTMTDNLTGFIWTKNANPANTSKTWQQAFEYIRTLNGINYLGHNDWRLPNINELASLVNIGQSNQATWLNGQGFTNIAANNFWSSNTSSARAYGINMGSGYVSKSFSTIYSSEYVLVWPVRGGQLNSSASLTLSAAKSGTGTGTVQSSTGGINCGSTCSTSITTGTSVTLTATPDSGSTFSGWTGACSGTGACTVSMDAAKSVTATFTLAPTIQTWTINTGNGANGTVSCTSPVNNAATSTCTVTPATGYQLSTFTDNSVDMKSSAAGGSYSITNVTANHTIAATFTLTTSTTGTTTKSKVFMGAGDDIFTVSNSGTTVYGNTGNDVVTIASVATGVNLDQNVEQINFSGASNSYTFKQTGNIINDYDTPGTILIAKAPVQGDDDGTLLSFSNGMASAVMGGGGVMTLGGAPVSSTAAGVITPVLTPVQ